MRRLPVLLLQVGLVAGLSVYSIGCSDKNTTGQENTNTDKDSATDAASDADSDGDSDAASDAQSDDIGDCASDEWGDECTKCNCGINQTCDKDRGCICANGFYGDNCEAPDCTNGILDNITGKCASCHEGWDIANNCNSCLDGFIGSNCAKKDCQNGIIDELTGKCSSCDTGWDLAKNCNDCSTDYYGDDCGNHCDCNGYSTCDSGTEGLGCQCLDAWQGDNCLECRNGGYGKDCAQNGSLDWCGDTYKTVIIGDLEWTAENIRCKTNVICMGNDFETYGCLYSWAQSHNNICPSDGGWRLPTKNDFDNLMAYAAANNKGNSDFLALIAKTDKWTDYKEKGLDMFGFAALPSGNFYQANVTDRGNSTVFLSQTEGIRSAGNDTFIALVLQNGKVEQGSYWQSTGYPARCVRNVVKE